MLRPSRAAGSSKKIFNFLIGIKENFSSVDFQKIVILVYWKHTKITGDLYIFERGFVPSYDFFRTGHFRCIFRWRID